MGYRARYRVGELRLNAGRRRYRLSKPEFYRHRAFDFDSRHGIELNGGDLSAWRDKSREGRDLFQATADLQPTYTASVAAIGGRPAVDFGGPADGNRLSAAAFAFAQPHTLLIVLKRDSTASGSGNRWLLDGLGGVGVGPFVNLNSSGNEQMFAGGALNWTASTSWQLLALVFNGTSSSGREDGVEQASGNVGTNAIAGLAIGSKENSDRTTGASEFFDGPVARLCAIGEALSGDSLRRLERGILKLYGL